MRTYLIWVIALFAQACSTAPEEESRLIVVQFERDVTVDDSLRLVAAGGQVQQSIRAVRLFTLLTLAEADAFESIPGVWTVVDFTFRDPVVSAFIRFEGGAAPGDLEDVRRLGDPLAQRLSGGEIAAVLSLDSLDAVVSLERIIGVDLDLSPPATPQMDALTHAQWVDASVPAWRR